MSVNNCRLSYWQFVPLRSPCEKLLIIAVLYAATNWAVVGFVLPPQFALVNPFKFSKGS